MPGPGKISRARALTVVFAYVCVCECLRKIPVNKARAGLVWAGLRSTGRVGHYPGRLPLFIFCEMPIEDGGTTDKTPSLKRTDVPRAGLHPRLSHAR